MLRELFKEVGFGWAVRVLAFLMLAGLSVSIAVLKQHGESKKDAPLFAAKHLRDIPFTLFILCKHSKSAARTMPTEIAYAFMVMGTYVPYFYIQKYALELNIDEQTTFVIVSVMNAATFFGRFPYNYLADMYGGISILAPCCLATSIILFMWRFVHTLNGLFVISATFCFVTGGLVSLPAVTIANLTTEKSEYRTRMGMGYTVAAIGALGGSPIAGALRHSGKSIMPVSTHAGDIMERWQGTWLFAAAAMLVATVLMVCARVLRGGLNLTLKI